MTRREEGRPRGRVVVPVLVAVALLAALALVLRNVATLPPPRGGTEVDSPAPVFSEEFGSSPLDSEWAVETPWHKQYTEDELQWYDPANVEFPGGFVRLTSKQEQVTGKEPDGHSYDYTSAMISTGSRTDYGGTSRASFTYGYFEMRAKLPKGRGVFPAFWLTNDAESEIDVMEMLGQEPDKIYMTLHQRVGGKDRAQRESYSGPDFSAGYHTFAVDWQRDYVRYYVDGVERAEFTEDIPDQPLWIVVNTAIGGPWPGDPDASTVFPQYYDIDYIRVWRTKPPARTGGS